MIVKVQVSIITNEDQPQVLIYNQYRTALWQGDAAKEILDLMGGEYKKYFYAKIVDTKFELEKEAPKQGW